MTSSFRKSIVREYFESIVIAVILALFIRTWVVQAFTIPTGSMEQNLLIGDYLLVNKFVLSQATIGIEDTLLPVGTVKRGDIVVFKFPEEPARDFIKRVIGLPGETLEVRGKHVYINDEPLDEPYLRDQMPAVLPGAVALDRRDNYGPVSVPDDHYFMMGDNRDDSQDSRFWGPLPHSHLKGKAMLVYWSYEAEQPAVRAEPGVGATIRRLSSVVVHFFTNTRWERIFHQVH